MATMVVDGVRLAGIPCQAEIDFIGGSRGIRENGMALEPDEEPYWTLERVLDRKGYAAPWLMTKLADPRVQEDFFRLVEQNL